MPEDHSAEPTRVEIVIDTDNANPDLLFILVSARAVKLVEQLRAHGVSAEIVKIDVGGRRHYSW